MSAHKAIIYSRKAHADLAAIARYTVAEWGGEQWQTYSRALKAGFNRIAEFPELGESHPGSRPGTRSIRIEMHGVYHRATLKTIRILRVRHIRASEPSEADL